MTYNSRDVESLDYTIRNVSTNEKQVVFSFRSSTSWDQNQIEQNRKKLVGRIFAQRNVIVLTTQYRLIELINGDMDSSTLDYVRRNAISVLTFTPKAGSTQKHLYVTFIEEMPQSVAEDLSSSAEFCRNLWLLIPKNCIDISNVREMFFDICKIRASAPRMIPLLQHEVVVRPRVSDGIEILWFNPEESIYSSRFSIISKKENNGVGLLDKVGQVLDGSRAGALRQKRFQMTDSGLSNETVAAVRDLSLGSIKPGRPVGRKIIRFDTGHGVNPHINIDPSGHPSANNLHIPVPAAVIKVANSKMVKYGGKAFTLATLAVEAYRIINAMNEDSCIKEHADEIIEELEVAISDLTILLEDCSDSSERAEIQTTIDYYENVLRDVKRTKKAWVQTIKTASSIGGGLSVGSVGGWAGSWAGAKTGATIGFIFGPAGTTIGAPIGAVVGALGGGYIGGKKGGFYGEKIADKALGYADDPTNKD